MTSRPLAIALSRRTERLPPRAERPSQTISSKRYAAAFGDSLAETPGRPPKVADAASIAVAPGTGTGYRRTVRATGTGYR
jgi:hypothetical protein